VYLRALAGNGRKRRALARPAPTTGQPAGRRGGPFDPRLLHYAHTTRRFIVLAIGVGGATALLVVAQAWLIATVVNDAFFHHGSLSSLRGPLGFLLAVIAGRAVLAWATERAAHRASASAKSELRHSATEHIAALGPTGLEHQENGRLTVLVTTGIDALDGYFSRYLPQLFLAVIVPITITAVVAGADWISAVLIAVTVPLIPVFMGLVGLTTRDRTAARMRSLQRLAGHFLDVVAGLPTLKVFGRAKAQARAIAEVTDRYRTTTLATLKLTFLSSLILELLATISVALVAVAVGLRLLDADMSFHAALFVLVLAPEAYLPLRALGANFHASADGMKAAEEVFELLETPVEGRATGAAHPPCDPSIRIAGLEVTYPGRRIPALQGADLIVEPGETAALTGPSGCGKSTLLNVILGLRGPSAGVVQLGGRDLRDLDLDAWRAGIGWVPQRPHLFARSVADNVRVARPGATDAEVAEALQAAGLAPVVGRLPQGIDTQLGEGGAGLSAGERQRLALARAFVRDAPLLVLDEPTASLDAETEADVLQAVRRLTEGRTALIVAHRPALAALADRVIRLPAPVVTA